ncbi:L domain-like protein [Dioscorea alata]|uniref:L domain-like protein n=1 Tax=Dioscorea alata TaxID=55571 RepID=A0ACB7U5U7_DIOAL|nr:L domain-like protein [Dioscorea alata]
MSKLPLLPHITVILMLLSSYFPLLVSSAKCHKDDKKALLKLFSRPEDLSWSSSTACCSWPGVICTSDTGRVISLDISSVNITGTISPSIGDLPLLFSIDIQYSASLTGTIPYSITKLPLTSLTIRFTSLSGPIPGFLGELKELTNLDLSGNLHTGPIPDSIASLPKLDRLTLFGNKLTGTIPPSLFRGLTSRNLLYLSDNLLTGEIPISLGDADLGYIYLAGNRFTGDASFLFSESKQANEIDLSRNQFEMDMSSLSFPQNLRLLDLSFNRIKGTIPASLARLNDLNSFNVSHNMLCGRIPTGAQMKSFDASCYQHNKCLCGTPLPSCHH